jgi:hypothetical protein
MRPLGLLAMGLVAAIVATPTLVTAHVIEPSLPVVPLLAAACLFGMFSSALRRQSS